MDADLVAKFLGQVLAYGGGAAAVAYLMFQHLGKTWIENKFSQQLDGLRHQQALEVQRLRVEIDALLSGALKLQEREFDVLPEAWAKLDEAHGLVSWLVSPMQQYANVDRMNRAQLEEFLAGTTFSESQKEQVRDSGDKGRTYQDIVFWYRLEKAKTAFRDLQRYVARNGIFMQPELKKKFTEISEKLWGAIVAREAGHEVNDWKIQREGWVKIQKEAEPLYKSIETDIQDRLQSHGRKPGS